MADDNGGASFDATTDSLNKINASLAAVLPVGTISTFNPASDTVDGVPYDSIFQLMAAMADGRFRIDYPTTGDITFYKRDNTTVLTTVHVTDTERTRS